MGGKETACLDPDFLKPILARRAPRSASLLCRFSAIEGSACNKSEPQVAASHQNSGLESLHAKKANEAAGGGRGVSFNCIAVWFPQKENGPPNAWLDSESQEWAGKDVLSIKRKVHLLDNAGPRFLA